MIVVEMVNPAGVERRFERCLASKRIRRENLKRKSQPEGWPVKMKSSASTDADDFKLEGEARTELTDESKSR
jgi:hypothetical protein